MGISGLRGWAVERGGLAASSSSISPASWRRGSRSLNLKLATFRLISILFLSLIKQHHNWNSYHFGPWSCSSRATSMILPMQAETCSSVVWKLPTTIRSTQSPWNSAGEQKPSLMFLIFAATLLVRSSETLPSFPRTWNSTTAYWNVCSLNRSGRDLMTSTRCLAFTSCDRTDSLRALRPQWRKVQQTLRELFLRASPTIQSLQSTMSQLSLKWFLQKENCSVLAPKDSFSSFLSPMQNSDPPVPFSSSFVKLTQIESTSSRMPSLGRYCSQIQVEPRKAASMFTQIPCALQNWTTLSSMSMAALKVLPQLPPNQKGMSPALTSSSTISTNLSKSSSQLSFFSLQTQGMALRQQISFTVSALSELMWLPCPKQPTNLSTSGLLPSSFSSFSFLNLAAWAETKIDSVAELLMIPPPLFLSRNFSGRPIALALQSIIVFSSSVKEGATAQLKLGVWNVVANISARMLVTLIEEGQQPKYFGDCQFITPGIMTFLVLSRRWAIPWPSSGALSGSSCLRNPGLTSGWMTPSVSLQHYLMSSTICLEPSSRVRQSQQKWDMIDLLYNLWRAANISSSWSVRSQPREEPAVIP